MVAARASPRRLRGTVLAGCHWQKSPGAGRTAGSRPPAAPRLHPNALGRVGLSRAHGLGRTGLLARNSSSSSSSSSDRTGPAAGAPRWRGEDPVPKVEVQERQEARARTSPGPLQRLRQEVREGGGQVDRSLEQIRRGQGRRQRRGRAQEALATVRSRLAGASSAPAPSPLSRLRGGEMRRWPRAWTAATATATTSGAPSDAGDATSKPGGRLAPAAAAVPGLPPGDAPGSPSPAGRALGLPSPAPFALAPGRKDHAAAAPSEKDQAPPGRAAAKGAPGLAVRTDGRPGGGGGGGGGFSLGPDGRCGSVHPAPAAGTRLAGRPPRLSWWPEPRVAFDVWWGGSGVARETLVYAKGRAEWEEGCPSPPKRQLSPSSSPPGAGPQGARWIPCTPVGLDEQKWLSAMSLFIRGSLQSLGLDTGRVLGCRSGGKGKDCFLGVF